MPKEKTSLAGADKKSKGFSDFEKAAMQERARELKAEERMKKDKVAGEKAILDNIAEMPEPDRSMAKRKSWRGCAVRVR